MAADAWLDSQICSCFHKVTSAGIASLRQSLFASSLSYTERSYDVLYDCNGSGEYNARSWQPLKLSIPYTTWRIYLTLLQMGQPVDSPSSSAKYLGLICSHRLRRTMHLVKARSSTIPVMHITLNHLGRRRTLK